MFLLQKRVLRAISIKHFTSSSTPIFSDLKILKLHDLFQLTLLCLCMIVLIRLLLLIFILFPLVASIHQYGTQQAIKTDIFVTRKILFNMNSGLCDILGQNAGIALLSMLNLHHLLLAFDKTLRPSSLRRITIHDEQPQVLCIHLLNCGKS